MLSGVCCKAIWWLGMGCSRGALRACPGIIQEPMRLTWNTALEETEMVLFETVHKLFKTTGVSPQDVRALPLAPGQSPTRLTTERRGLLAAWVHVMTQVCVRTGVHLPGCCM